jgi:Fic family protein
MPFNPILPYNELDLLPPDFDYNSPKLLKLVIGAKTQLAELKGYSMSLPNPLLLLSPAILKESVASSEIENIHTTILNVLENQLFTEDERREPDKEVLRYREAIMWGFENLKKVKLSTRLISGIQDKLLPSQPKGYRKQQNAIEDKKNKKILYTPPIQSQIPKYMGNLENFLNEPPKEMDPLIACAIEHYQFEAIHPFEDGNGRTGRIMMVLHLVNAGVLNLPILYISGYINENKTEYYQRLLEVTTEGKWTEYLEFMLKGYEIQAEATKDIIFKIMSLFWELKKEIKIKDKTVYSADFVETIFTFPIISPVKLARELGVHYTTASRYLRRMKTIGIMTDKKIGKYHFYLNRKLIELIHGS